MKKTNVEIETMIMDLKPLLDCKGLTGLVAARNTRILSELIQEYLAMKQELIIKYGVPQLDCDGNRTDYVAVTPETNGFTQFVDELTPLAEAEQEFTVMKVPAEKVMSELTGSQMIALDWMFEEVSDGYCS